MFPKSATVTVEQPSHLGNSNYEEMICETTELD